MADNYVKIVNEDDYIIDVPSRTIGLSDSGIDKAKLLNLENLYDIESSQLWLTLSCLRANYIMILDIDYVVSEDQRNLDRRPITGRTMEERRYSDGLPGGEAKKVFQFRRNQNICVDYLQNLFRMYKLSEMTGTGKTEREEFREIYNIRDSNFNQIRCIVIS